MYGRASSGLDRFKKAQTLEPFFVSAVNSSSRTSSGFVRNLFGRQVQACDFVLDHQSVSRQHAAVVPHKNGSLYVIDLGSAHGTFVANERLTKDSPVELEVGQSLRFSATTRPYVLRKNEDALFPNQLHNFKVVSLIQSVFHSLAH